MQCLRQRSQIVGAGMKESAVFLSALPIVGAGMKESAVFISALLVGAGKRGECSMYCIMYIGSSE